LFMHKCVAQFVGDRRVVLFMFSYTQWRNFKFWPLLKTGEIGD